MKKISLFALLATIGFAFSAFTTHKTSTGSDFEGIITYSMSTGQTSSKSGQMPPIKMYIKGGKPKTVSDMGMQKQITITDCNTPDDPIVLVEVNGNKYQIKNDKTKKDVKDPVIKYTNETKQIVGYTCHKAEMTLTNEKGQSSTMDVYYAEDIARKICDQKFKGLKGFPLEWTMKINSMTMTTIATKVDKQSLSDGEFTIPTGYKLVTQQEMQQDMMKSMMNNRGGKN